MKYEVYLDFESLVESKGYDWDDDIRIFEGYDWEDYGREIFENNGYTIDESLLDFFDYEAYGESCGINNAETYSGGIIEIY